MHCAPFSPSSVSNIQTCGVVVTSGGAPTCRAGVRAIAWPTASVAAMDGVLMAWALILIRTCVFARCEWHHES